MAWRLVGQRVLADRAFVLLAYDGVAAITLFHCMSPLFFSNKYVRQPSRQTRMLTAKKMPGTAKVFWISAVKVKYKRSTIPDKPQAHA